MIDPIRPYGFLKVCYYESQTQVPEISISPEDISSFEAIYRPRLSYGPAETSAMRLKDGRSLILYNCMLPELTKKIDEAMRERLNLRMPSQPTENGTPKKPMCVCGHDHHSHGEHGNGGGCRGASGPYAQCGCAKWERA
jgi:hypothetical protein